MTKYTTMITKDYVPDWEVEDGIREFVANALDSDYPFEYEITDNSISLTSKGVTLPASVLTLGTSGNRLKVESVGQHGEGILVGLVPILRSGGTVEFINGSKIWNPCFEYSEQFDKEVLVIHECQVAHGEDYTVNISNVSKSVLDSVIDRCLYLQEDIGEVLEGTTGRILKDIAGKLYVGGLYVTAIPTYAHSYDFKPQYLQLNRDRKSVEGWNLQAAAARLTKEVLEPLEIAELIEKNKADIQSLQFGPDIEQVADVLYNRLVEKHGEDVVVCEWYDDQENLEQKGYKNVVNVSHSTYKRIVEKSPKYQEKLEQLTEELDIPEEDTRTPVEILEDWWVEQDPDAFEKMLEVFRDRGVSFDSKASSRDLIPF